MLARALNEAIWSHCCMSRVRRRITLRQSALRSAPSAAPSWLILPDGQITSYNQKNVKTLSQKYSPSIFPKFMVILSPSRLHWRGVSRSSRTLEAGCGGRGEAQRAWARRRTHPCGRPSRVVL